MKKTLVLALFTFASLVTFAQQTKTNIVILDPIATFQITDGTDVIVREITSSLVVNSGIYNVIDRRTVSKIMEEQEFARSGLMDETQAVQIGKLAGAKSVLFSVLANVGHSAMLSSKLIDVKSGVVEKQEYVMLDKSTNIATAIEKVTTSLLYDDNFAATVAIRDAEEAKQKAQDEAAKKAALAGLNTFGSRNSYNLNGRSIQGTLPTPIYVKNIEGVIVVSIEVNATGTVIYAKAGAAGTTIGDATMRRDAETAAKRAKFNRIRGNAIQTGTITYRYKLN